MKNNWVYIKGYGKRYMLHPSGVVKSMPRKGVRKERILKGFIDGGGYYSYVLTNDLNPKKELLHRLLYSHFKGELIEGLVIDHIDNNKLNNHINNLQQITIRENGSKDRKGGTSKYLGVSWCKIKEKWRATIYDGVKRKHVGYFEIELEASKAYNAAKQEILKIQSLKQVAA